MSARRKTIRPGKKAKITNNGTTDIQVWTGESPRKYGSVKPKEFCEVFNHCDTDLTVQWEDNEDIQIKNNLNFDD